MIEAKAQLKYVRVTAQKARRLIALVNNKQAYEAIAICQFAHLSLGSVLAQLITSAMSNARIMADASNTYLDEKDLYISDLFVDEGATYKRYRQAARGRAMPVKKRTSHITVFVATPDIGGES